MFGWFKNWKSIKADFNDAAKIVQMDEFWLKAGSIVLTRSERHIPNELIVEIPELQQSFHGHVAREPNRQKHLQKINPDRSLGLWLDANNQSYVSVATFRDMFKFALAGSIGNQLSINQKETVLNFSERVFNQCQDYRAGIDRMKPMFS